MFLPLLAISIHKIFQRVLAQCTLLPALSKLVVQQVFLSDFVLLYFRDVGKFCCLDLRSVVNRVCLQNCLIT